MVSTVAFDMRAYFVLCTELYCIHYYKSSHSFVFVSPSFFLFAILSIVSFFYDEMQSNDVITLASWLPIFHLIPTDVLTALSIILLSHMHYDMSLLHVIVIFYGDTCVWWFGTEMSWMSVAMIITVAECRHIRESFSSHHSCINSFGV